MKIKLIFLFEKLILNLSIKIRINKKKEQGRENLNKQDL